MRLVLSPADRQRFGCPDELPIDLDTLTNREAVLLQELGFATITVLGRRLQFKTTEDGDTLIDYAAWDAFVWLALRRVGVNVDVHTFEYDVHALRLGSDEKAEPLPDAPDDPGKAEGPVASTSSPTKKPRSGSTRGRRSTRTG